MSIEELIINVYCLVDELYQKNVGTVKLRQRGPAPALLDTEVLTMLIVGEYLSLASDKGIWAYFVRHWSSWFPGLGCRTSFSRQSANLWWIQDHLREALTKSLSQDTDLSLFDGFPIPVAHIKRYKRFSPFRGEGAIGYCAAKDQKYFGFKGHLLISFQGVTRAFEMAPASIDERDVLPEIVKGIQGDVIADKGLIRPELTEMLRKQGLFLHTPLRKNMDDPRPASFIACLMNVRRRVETVIGQYTDRFKIQVIRARDLWHLTAKVGRKILAHTVCFFLNQFCHPNCPLQLERLLNDT